MHIFMEQGIGMDTGNIYESVLFRTLLTVYILLSIFYLSFLVKRWTRELNPTKEKILLGVYFGLISNLMLMFNLYLGNRDLIDVGLVMTGIVAAYFGLVSACITLCMMLIGSFAIFGSNFASGIFIAAMAACTMTGYVLRLVGKLRKHNEKAWYLYNLLVGFILSLQAVIWKYLILNLSGVKVNLLDSGLHKAAFFLLISFSVSMMLRTESEIKVKTRELEKANCDLNMANNDLNRQNEKVQAAYELLAASEEELRAQNKDIQTAYKQIAVSEEEYEALFNVGNEALWRSDPQASNIKYSDKLLEIFGYKPHESEDFQAIQLQRRHPNDAAMVEEYERNLFSGRINRFIIEYRTRRRDGQYIWLRTKATRFINKDGQDIGFVGSVLDISEVKDYENKILDMAYTDSLTGLPNRRAFVEGFQSRLDADRDGLLHGALFFVDTDNFKYINDLMGHNVGDDILRETGSRLRMLDNNDNRFISRMGGDEFVIVCYGRYNREEINQKAKEIAEAFSTPYEINGRKLQLTISMGITIYPEDGRTVDKLLKNADIAMYKAKDKGKDCWCFFENRLEEEASERIMMVSHLSKAVENGEMTLYYQPQVNILENKIIGFEALIRWNSPVFGMVSPSRFIPVAEDSGIIIQLGKWILREACLFSRELNKNNPDDLKFISVNISPLEIMQPDFLETVERTVRETEIEPDMLGIEITETALIESFKTVADKMDFLRRMGIWISLDDFGMGFSSLNHLRTLPINTVKIDKTFITAMIKDDRSRIITEEIIMLSHKLGVDTVAEGVEKEIQVELLKKIGCDVIQGYFYSRPMPGDDALRFYLR